jgi:hypothetical protein
MVLQDIATNVSKQSLLGLIIVRFRVRMLVPPNSLRTVPQPWSCLSLWMGIQRPIICVVTYVWVESPCSCHCMVAAMIMQHWLALRCGPVPELA